MNATQLQTTLAPIIAAIAGFLAGRGYFGLDQATWLSVIAGIGTAATAIWGAYTARKSALVTTVANMPEVKEVSLDASATGQAGTDVSALSRATPSNVVVK
jgi:hypothetical protein